MDDLITQPVGHLIPPQHSMVRGLHSTYRDDSKHL